MVSETDQKNLPEPWRKLRKLVVAEGCVLGEAVFERVLQVFVDQYAEASLKPALLTPEYERDEFLLAVDEQGKATGTSPEILGHYIGTAVRYPELKKWFLEAKLPEGGSALLAARWLCHLIGLRHSTVEIFIDPPHLNGYTLVQVRGMDKYEAPGAFDIACAGHIPGVETAEEALRKELAEELNLTLDDLNNLRLLQRYNSYSGGGVNISVNNEYRVLYIAKLRSAATGRIRFTDGEVAGLAIFSVKELRLMVDRYPERIASGLKDAIDFYTS
jgi:isopentenyldiphosphate isomerase